MHYTTEPIDRSCTFYFNGYDIDQLSGNQEYEFLMFVRSNIEDSGIEYDSEEKLLTIKYNEGNPLFNVERLYTTEMRFTPFAVRRYTPEIVVGEEGSFRLRKLTYEPLTFTLLWISDFESSIAKIDELNYSILLKPSEEVTDAQQLQGLLEEMKLIKLTSPVESEISVHNIIEVLIGNRDIKIKGSGIVFNTNLLYRNYRIEQEDYIHALITEMKSVLGDLEVTHMLSQKKLCKPNILYYKLVSTTRKTPPFMATEFSDDTSVHSSKIEFQLSLLDHDSYNDYLIKLDSVLRVSNCVKYKTQDIYGDDWTYSVWWEHSRDQDEKTDFSKDDHESLTYTIEFSGIITYIVKMRRELRSLVKTIMSHQIYSYSHDK